MEKGASGQGAATLSAAPSLFDAHDHTRLWLQSKLSGEWSAQAGAGGLTEERLAALSRGFGSLDSMVKVRLLLAGLFVPRADRTRLQTPLAELSGQAASSQDEWVRATAAVCGDYSGVMDMRALMAQFPLVRDTVTSLGSQLADLDTPPYLLPQTEQYMHRDISRLPSGAPTAPAATGAAKTATAAAAASSGGGRTLPAHFRLRNPPTASLADLGLMPPGAGAGGGGAQALLQLGLGSGPLSGLAGGGLTLDVKGGGPGAAGPGRGLPGTSDVASSLLRSRADISHNTAAKDAKQGPPTPSGKSATGGPGLPGLRLGRARSLVGLPDGAPLESPHGHPGQLPAPGLLLLPLGRRDSSGHVTPRHGWPPGGGTPHQHTFGSAPNSAVLASAAAVSGMAAELGFGPGSTALPYATGFARTSEPPSGGESAAEMESGQSGELAEAAAGGGGAYSLQGPPFHRHSAADPHSHPQGDIGRAEGCLDGGRGMPHRTDSLGNPDEGPDPAGAGQQAEEGRGGAPDGAWRSGSGEVYEGVMQEEGGGRGGGGGGGEQWEEDWEGEEGATGRKRLRTEE